MKHLILGLGGIGGNVVRLVREKAPDHVYALLDSDIENCEQWHAEGIPYVHLGSPHDFRTLTYMDTSLHTEQWFPNDPFLLSQQASSSCGHRVAGRLLFEIALGQGRMQTLARLMEEILHGPAAMGPMDITIVTTLSGGTGSGCLLPLALWLRKILQQRYNLNPYIRGVFLLPEAIMPALRFLPAHRTDYLYRNAAAALKELDAIEGVFAGNRNTPPFSIGELFDSNRDYGTGNHVFDHCYVLGDDAPHRSMDAILEHAADVVHTLATMQCIRSMENAILFSSQLQYKAIGVGIARYPSDHIRKYCVSKLMLQMFDDPWYRLDEEVIRRKAEAPVKLQHVDIYREVFRETAKASPDALPALQVCDEDAMAYSEQPSEKLEQFLRRVDTVAQAGAQQLCGLKLPEPVANSSVSGQMLEDMLRDAVEQLHEALERVDIQAGKLVRDLAEELLPYYSPIPFDGAGLLFSHRGESVHPAAARFMIYEVSHWLEKQLHSIDPELQKRELLDMLLSEAIFDNPRTPGKETTLKELLDSKPFFLHTEKHLMFCRDRLLDAFNQLQQKFDLYRKSLLHIRLYEILLEHFNVLAGCYEAVFHILPDIREYLQAHMDDEPAPQSATCWLCSGQEALADIYREVKTRFRLPNGLIHDELRMAVEKTFFRQGLGMVGLYITPADVLNALTEPLYTALDDQCAELTDPDLLGALQLHHRADGTAPTPAWLTECADALIPLAAPARISDDTDFSEHSVAVIALKPGYPAHLIPTQPPCSQEASVEKDMLVRIQIDCGILTYDLLHGRSALMAHYIPYLQHMIDGQGITPHMDIRWHTFL